MFSQFLPISIKWSSSSEETQPFYFLRLFPEYFQIVFIRDKYFKDFKKKNFFL